MSRDKNSDKKNVREAIRRWHPDKFEPKMKGRIAKSHFAEVMAHTKFVSQAILTGK